MLAPFVEADLEELVARLPDDVELDPSATRYEGVEPGTRRGTVVYQGYWRGYGTWSPEAWRLDFAVRRRGELLGRQELEGNDFPKLRIVDSWPMPAGPLSTHMPRMNRASSLRFSRPKPIGRSVFVLGRFSTTVMR